MARKRGMKSALKIVKEQRRAAGSSRKVQSAVGNINTRGPKPGRHKKGK